MRRLIWSALAIVMASTAVGAQERSESEPPHAGGEIVVEADRDRATGLSGELRRMAIQHESQLARLQQPVCPSVRGLPEDQAEVVAAGINRLAQQAGLRVETRDCRPNLMVVIADDGPAFIARLKRKRPEAFGMVTVTHYRNLRSEPGPTWSWQSVEPRRADGGPVQYISEFGSLGRPPQRLPKGAYQVQNAQLSRLSQPVRFDVGTAWVVIDQASAVGLTLRQIGDFAAIAGLTGARVSQGQLPLRPSILRIFADRAEGTAIEEGATAFDLAFLRARHNGSPAQSADFEFRRIALELVRNEGAALE